jgi:hypothetical protein
MHLDFCALLSIFSYFGSKYFFTFTNDFNKNNWVLFLKKKSKTLNTVKMFKVVVKNKTYKKAIKAFKNDHGGESCHGHTHNFVKTMAYKGSLWQGPHNRIEF